VIDTHAHLDGDDGAVLVARAREAGVTRIVAIGSGLDAARRTLALAEREEGVFAALGLHPHQAADGESLDELRDLLSNERVVAVGEIGLDFFRDYAPHDAQRRLLEEQLQLASDLRKPVVIHSRAADDETVEALGGFVGGVVLHCFSSPALLPVAVEQGWYVSFAGNVTFPKAEELREAAAELPDQWILAETDTPYLAPQPVRGRPNEPANVMHTLAALAEVRGVEPAALEALIDANATAAFSLP
jgi:TatD DNase family protein